MNINNEAHSHFLPFKDLLEKKKNKNTFPQSNLEHIVKYSTYESKNGIEVEELSHTKLVFAV